MKAMLLAAGLGTRLRPHSLLKPKPLFPVLNIPLLQLTLNRLRKAGFETVIVNAFHLKDQIKAAVADEKGVILQEENNVLGTGGGIRMALQHFAREPVLVVNGDIYHTIDYRQVYKNHCDSKEAVTLVLHDFPRFNSVFVDGHSRVRGFHKSPSQPGSHDRILAFTGIHVIDPSILQSIPLDTNYSIIECYSDYLAKHGTIRAYIAKNHFWTDIGSPEDYLQLHADLLNKKIPLYEELTGSATDTLFIAEDVSVGNNVKIDDWASIGHGVIIGDNVNLARVVVWDNSKIPDGSTLMDQIVTGATE
jgi:mannose-1-phosphate guanylyltransferase